MDKNENIHEQVSRSAITEVNSSMILDSDEFEICNEVITKRQKPNRFAEVDKICWEVFVAIIKTK